MATVLKTANPQGFVGSNPTPSVESRYKVDSILGFERVQLENILNNVHEMSTEIATGSIIRSHLGLYP